MRISFLIKAGAATPAVSAGEEGGDAEGLRAPSGGADEDDGEDDGEPDRVLQRYTGVRPDCRLHAWV